MSNPYPGGQCTWGAAEMFPCLQSLGQYGNFGNGGDWFDHAQSIGLPTSKTPQPGWLASFATEGWPSGPGDVGLIVSVNNDGTITRYGTNWHGDGKWSTDKVHASIVIGSFQAPCSGSNLPAAAANASTMASASQSSADCQTFKWQFPLGISLCFDSLIGMAAFGGGALLMAAGLLVIVMGATNQTPSLQVQQEPTKQEDQPQGLAPSEELDARLLVQRARDRAAARQATRRRVNVNGTPQQRRAATAAGLRRNEERLRREQANRSDSDIPF